MDQIAEFIYLGKMFINIGKWIENAEDMQILVGCLWLMHDQCLLNEAKMTVYDFVYSVI